MKNSIVSILSAQGEDSKHVYFDSAAGGTDLTLFTVTQITADSISALLESRCEIRTARCQDAGFTVCSQADSFTSPHLFTEVTNGLVCILACCVQYIYFSLVYSAHYTLP